MEDLGWGKAELSSIDMNEGECCWLWVLHLPQPRTLLVLNLLVGLRKLLLHGLRH
jgi:hypothetical protein